MVQVVRIFEFGEWRLNPTERLLLRDGEQVPLTPKAFETLLLLVENAGHLVAKEQFMSKVWPGIFVEDVALAQNISQLRRVLQSSDPDAPRIETVPKRGYRLVGLVRETNPDLGQSLAPAVRPETELLTPEPSIQVSENVSATQALQRSAKFRPFRLASGAIALCAVLPLMGLIAFIAVHHQGGIQAAGLGRLAPREAASAITPLISLPGEESMPAFSPDGSRVVFRWQSPEAKKSGLYAVVVGSESLLRLTSDANDICATWSPDGRFIAFLRISGENFSLYIVPALGGSERRLYTGSRNPWIGPEGISFSRDGSVIAFAEWSAEARTSAIKTISLHDSTVRTITEPPAGYHDSAPAFAPDGERLAFVRTSGPIFLDELYVMRLSGGEPRQLTFDHHRLFGSLVWTDDSKEIFFASNRAGLKSLWRISAAGGTPEPVLGPGPVADHPSIASSTGQLAYEYSIEDENLWRVGLGTPTAGGHPLPLFSSKTSNLMPQYSPDGKKIAFEGDRSGYEEIWICDPDGSNAVQATHLQRFSGSPRWSPDGRSLAFDSRMEEHGGIYILNLDSGEVRSVPTFADADNVVPSWSRDGQWIYFTSDHNSKTFHVWKVPVSGGAPVQVTTGAGFAAFESADGKFIYYAKLSAPGIWRISKYGGAETRIWSGPGPDNWANWTLTEDAIYLMNSERGKRSVIQRLDLATRHSSLVSTLERPAFYGLTVSGNSIVYAQRDRDEHDVLVTKLFH